MKYLTSLLSMILLACCTAYGDLIPKQYYTNDVSKPTVSKPLTFRQATSQGLYWTYLQGSTPKDLTGATLITFTYVPYDKAWSQVVTGALDVATNGSVVVNFTPAQLNTNSGSRMFDFLLEVTDGTDVLGYTYGKLNLLADPTSGVTNAFPTTTQTIDWSDYAAYENTASHGPVRPGTGITTVTNADGSVTFSASDSGVTDHSLLSNLAWTQSGHTGTPARLAGFFEGGAAGYSSPGAGLYFDDEDKLAVSNDIVVGTAGSNGAVAWVTLQGYGTGNLSKTTADVTYAPINVTGDLTKAVADVTYAPISVVDTTFTNYLAGDTEIVVAGDARSGSNVLSIGSTITRDTELAAYLPLAGGTMANGSTLYFTDANMGILRSEMTPILSIYNSVFPSFTTTLSIGTNGVQVSDSTKRLIVDGSISEGGTLLSAKYFPLTGGSGYAVVNAVTNNLALEWWTASNRWAYVERYGSTTNVTFLTPAR